MSAVCYESHTSSFIGLLVLWLTNLYKLSVHQKNMMKYKTGILHYAIKKIKFNKTIILGVTAII